MEILQTNMGHLLPGTDEVERLPDEETCPEDLLDLLKLRDELLEALTGKLELCRVINAS